MKHLHYSADAIRDMDEIWDHIATVLGNPIAAAATIDHLQDQIEQLADFPSLGTPISSPKRMKDQYRYLVSGNYMVFYRTEASDIHIDRVLYGRRDYLHVLFEGLPEPADD